MIIPYSKTIKYTEPLIVNMYPDVEPDDVYTIVINYASKASYEYEKSEMWFDATSQFMRAKINIELMLAELNELFCINLSDDELKKCAGYLLSDMGCAASEYIKEHSFLKKFIVSGCEFPEADVNYALVILAYEMYLSVLFLLSLDKKEIAYKNITNKIASQTALYKESGRIDTKIIDLDNIVMSHRKYITEQSVEG